MQYVKHQNIRREKVIEFYISPGTVGGWILGLFCRFKGHTLTHLALPDANVVFQL